MGSGSTVPACLSQDPAFLDLQLQVTKWEDRAESADMAQDIFTESLCVGDTPQPHRRWGDNPREVKNETRVGTSFADQGDLHTLKTIQISPLSRPETRPCPSWDPFLSVLFKELSLLGLDLHVRS